MKQSESLLAKDAIASLESVVESLEFILKYLRRKKWQ
jgi:hypothetical protein